MSEGHYMRLSIRCPHCGSKTVAEDHKHIDRTADTVSYTHLTLPTTPYV